MNSKTVISSALILILMGTGTVALAGDSGFFVNGRIGSTIISVSGISDDDSDTSFSGSVGYDFNKHFAVALGYDRFGSHNIGVVSIDDTMGYNIRVIGTVPLSENWSIFGQLGNQHWETDITTPTGTTSEDGDDLLVGVGAKWNISDVFSLLGGLDFFEDQNVDVGTFYIGGEYRFRP